MVREHAERTGVGGQEGMGGDGAFAQQQTVTVTVTHHLLTLQSSHYQSDSDNKQ